MSKATDPSVTLQTIVSWTLDGSAPIYDGVDPRGIDPRCIRQLGGGKLLVVNRRYLTDDSTAFIAVIDRGGNEEWSYRPSDDPDLRKPFCAERFVREGQTYTLIADRDAARVFAVDADKRIVWQYGAVGEQGLDVDRLQDPYWATYTDDDTVLISDNLGAFRVIEVRWSDYEPGAPAHGFTADSIVWQYGTPGEPGMAPGQLTKPHVVQRVPGGALHTLITDADADVVYEVDHAGRIVWQFGVPGQEGKPARGLLDGPTCAERLDDGSTLIADTDGQSVVRVGQDGDVLASYDLAKLDRPSGISTTALSEPRMVTPAADGSLLVADSGFDRFVEIGLPAQASFTSASLDMGESDVRKRFLAIGWSGETPSGTGVSLEYRVAGGAWTALAGTTASLPASAVGTSLQYRVTLSSAARTIGPRLDAVAVRWRRVATSEPAAKDEPRRTGPGVAYMGGSSGTTGTVVWGGSGAGGGSPGGSGTGGGSVTGSAAEGAASGVPPDEVTSLDGGGQTELVTGSPVRVTAEGTGGEGGGDVPAPVASTGVWVAAGALVLVAVAVPPLAGRRLQRRLDMTTDVPATATRDARLLKGAR